MTLGIKRSASQGVCRPAAWLVAMPTVREVCGGSEILRILERRTSRVFNAAIHLSVLEVNQLKPVRSRAPDGYGAIFMRSAPSRRFYPERARQISEIVYSK